MASRTKTWLWAALGSTLALSACGQGTSHSNRSRNEGDADDRAPSEAESDGPASGDEGDAGRGDDAPAGGDWQMPQRPTCLSTYAAPISAGTPGVTALVETSGIVASPQNPGVLWLHNDSGTAAVLYAVGTDGTWLASLTLDSVTLVDPEDIAAAPCPEVGMPCLWIADTGDNDRQRTDAALVAVAEPRLDAGDPFATIAATEIWRLPLTFAGGPVDVEAVAVTPDGGAVYFFEKVDAASAHVYLAVAPFVADQPIFVQQVGSFTSPGVPIARGRMVTGAELHPAGDRLLLRLYTGVFEYRLGGRTPVDLDAAEKVVVAWGPASEGQGEAVAYAESGVDVWTISEDPDGQATQPLHFYGCQDPP